MASEALPTAPQTPEPVDTASTLTEPSLERLDRLLEDYLELLDQYTKLWEQLSKQFSDGFFALARANHTSHTLGSGRRYGEEGYDERMKPQRRVGYQPRGAVRGARKGGAESTASRADTEDDGSYSITVDKISAEQGQQMKVETDSGPTTTRSNTSTVKFAPSKNEDTPAEPSITEPKAKTKSTPANRDPLHWYGILVPPPLRQAQAAFTTAVDGAIPSLLNVSARMAELEVEITEMRRDLGVEPDQDNKETTEATTTPVESARDSPTENNISNKGRKSPIRLAPRSRILKFDG